VVTATDCERGTLRFVAVDVSYQPGKTRIRSGRAEGKKWVKRSKVPVMPGTRLQVDFRQFKETKAGYTSTKEGGKLITGH